MISFAHLAPADHPARAAGIDRTARLAGTQRTCRDCGGDIVRMAPGGLTAVPLLEGDGNDWAEQQAADLAVWEAGR